MSRSYTLFAALERDHRKTLHQINRLYDVLTHLRYEGKQHRQENFREIKRLAGDLRKELKTHMKEEEKVLFPNLEVSIPKLEPLIDLLRFEHLDLDRRIDDLSDCIRRMSKLRGMTPERIQELNEQGTYFVCLLKGHMQLESRSLYGIADQQLKMFEKARILKQIAIR